MVYKGKGKKGSKFIGMGVGYLINNECKECIYKQQGSCSGRHDAINPCLFSKTKQNDTVDNWIEY